MKPVLFTLAAAGFSWWLNCATTYAQQELPPEPVPVQAGAIRVGADSYEQLTRGPVHEAFAQAVTPAVEDGLIVPKEPPAMIEEIPPARRPAGDDIAWIPGYWGWDDERADFIWISGIWRAVPPSREWVPGYWARASAGYQWISGYWADMRVSEVEYLPSPPETVDAGPNTQAPTGNEIWVPGCWVWQQNRYVWRAGYWAKGNPQWVWTNAHYVYTTRGYIYVGGYWDFPVQQRGVLFAPVYFNAPVARSYVYSPRVVVNSAALIDNLFLRPTYRHYYFGDYYAANYRGRGILPWFTFNNSRYGYDSLYSYHRWNNRNDNNWEQSVVARYDDLRDREDGRPPRTYADWQKQPNRASDRNPFIAGSIQDYGKLQGSRWQYRDITDDARRDAGRMAADMDKYRQQRIKIEAEKTARTDDVRNTGDRVKLLKPPVGDIDRTAPGRENFREYRGEPGRPNIDKPGEDRPGRDVVIPPTIDRTPQVKPEVPVPRPIVPQPGLEERPNRVPGKRPNDRLDSPIEAPKSPKNLPGPLNDIRNPPTRPSAGADTPNTNRDRPGPLSDLRDNPRDPPKTAAPRVERDNRPKLDSPQPKAERPKAAPPPRATPRETPRVNPQPPREAPRDVPKATPAPRDPPNQPEAGGGDRPKGGDGNPGKGKGKDKDKN